MNKTKSKLKAGMIYQGKVDNMKSSEYYRKFRNGRLSITEYQIVQMYIVSRALSGKLNIEENINIKGFEYQCTYIELFNYIIESVDNYDFHYKKSNGKKDYICLKLLYLIRELEGDNHEEN